jgi:hypothetical protein
VTAPRALAVHGDRESIYSIADDGTLWAWQAASCDAPAPVTAEKVAGMPPVSELAHPLFLRTGPQRWEVVRCALGTDGATHCWTIDRDYTANTVKRTIYELAALPTAKTR